MWEALSGLGSSIVGGLGSIGSGLAGLFGGGAAASPTYDALGNIIQTSSEVAADAASETAKAAAGAAGTSVFDGLTKTFQPMNSFLTDNKGMLGLAAGLGDFYNKSRMADVAEGQLASYNRDVLRNQSIDDQNANSINNAFKPYVTTPTTDAAQGLASRAVAVPKVGTPYASTAKPPYDSNAVGK